MKAPTVYEAIAEVSCPDCNARAGEDCAGMVSACHGARMLAAIRARLVASFDDMLGHAEVYVRTMREMVK